jgi:hypothetical protein
MRLPRRGVSVPVSLRLRLAAFKGTPTQWSDGVVGTDPFDDVIDA